MSLDSRGKKIEVGQEVIMRFKVLAVRENEHYGNVDLESFALLPGTGLTTKLSSVNTRQLEVVAEAGIRTTGPSNQLSTKRHSWSRETGYVDLPEQEQAPAEEELRAYHEHPDAAHLKPGIEAAKPGQYPDGQDSNPQQVPPPYRKSYDAA